MPLSFTTQKKRARTESVEEEEACESANLGLGQRRDSFKRRADDLWIRNQGTQPQLQSESAY